MEDIVWAAQGLRVACKRYDVAWHPGGWHGNVVARPAIQIDRVRFGGGAKAYDRRDCEQGDKSPKSALHVKEYLPRMFLPEALRIRHTIISFTDEFFKNKLELSFKLLVDSLTQVSVGGILISWLLNHYHNNLAPQSVLLNRQHHIGLS